MNVDSEQFWLGNEYVTLRFNIDGKGVYSCTLPPVLAKHSGQKKVSSHGLNIVRDEARSIVRSYKEANAKANPE